MMMISSTFPIPQQLLSFTHPRSDNTVFRYTFNKYSQYVIVSHNIERVLIHNILLFS